MKYPETAFGSMIKGDTAGSGKLSWRTSNDRLNLPHPGFEARGGKAHQTHGTRPTRREPIEVYRSTFFRMPMECVPQCLLEKISQLNAAFTSPLAVRSHERMAWWLRYHLWKRRKCQRKRYDELLEENGGSCAALIPQNLLHNLWKKCGRHVYIRARPRSGPASKLPNRNTRFRRRILSTSVACRNKSTDEIRGPGYLSKPVEDAAASRPPGGSYAIYPAQR